MTAKRNLEERRLQSAIVARFRSFDPPNAVILALCNEAVRSPREGAAWKRAGLQPGAPDLMVFAGGRALGLEVKTATGRVRPNQRAFAEVFERRAGCPLVVVRSESEALVACARFGVRFPEPIAEELL